MQSKDTLEVLADAAHDGDVVAIQKVLQTLGPKFIERVYILSFEVDSPRAQFELLEWVALQPEPFPDSHRHRVWLWAMNNASLRAIHLDEVDQGRRLAIAERALSHGPQNHFIFQNVAGVFAQLGLHDRAMEAVRGAVEHQVEGVGAFPEDPDLSPLFADPEFMALVGPETQRFEEQVAQRLSELSQSCFDYGEVPEVVAKLVRFHLRGWVLPPGIDEIRGEAPPNLHAAVEGALYENVSWFATASAGQKEWSLGWARPNLGLPSDTVIAVEVSQGDLMVGASFWELLLRLGDYSHRPATWRKEVCQRASQLDDPIDPEPQGPRTRGQALDEQLAMRLSAPEHPPATFDIPTDGPLVNVGLLHPISVPWSGNPISRIGGPPVGVDAQTRPHHVDGTPWAHCCTIELTDCDQPHDAEAVALFKGPGHSETQLVWLSADDLEKGDWQGRPGPDLPRRTLIREILEVPRRLFEDPSTWSPSDQSFAEVLRPQSLVGPLVHEGQRMGLRIQKGFVPLQNLEIGVARNIFHNTDPEDRTWLTQYGFAVEGGFDPWVVAALGPDSLLEQVLQRLCVMVNDCFPMGFVLEKERLEISIGNQTQAVPLAFECWEQGLDAILQATNICLAKTTHPWRVVSTNTNPTRVVTVPIGWIGNKPGLDEGCLEPGFTPSHISSGALLPPTVPTIEGIVGPERFLPRDFGYDALLARYLNDASAFAGTSLEVEPRPTSGAEAMELTASGEKTYTTTLRIPGASRADLNRALNDLNAMRKGPRKLYQVNLAPGRRGLVNASKQEAEQLRHLGYLCEDWRRRWFETLWERTGFEVDNYDRGIQGLLKKMGLLSVGLVPLVFEQRVLKVGTTELAWSGLDPGSSIDALQAFLPDLNTALVTHGAQHRWVGHKARYSWRLGLLPLDWAALAGELFEDARATLEPGFAFTGPSPLPIAFPRPNPQVAFPRLQTLEQMIPKDRIHWDDFKVPARSSDLPEVLTDLVKLVGLKVVVEDLARQNGDNYEILVTFEGEHSKVVTDDSKYTNPRPMLDYLNGLLKRKGSDKRLFQFSDGAVFVDKDEAHQLKAADYIWGGWE